MPLHPGTTLGPYAVTAKIGEGGMGEVYRARDTKLHRDVTLKVLPQAFTDDSITPSILLALMFTDSKCSMIHLSFVTRRIVADTPGCAPRSRHRP